VGLPDVEGLAHLGEDDFDGPAGRVAVDDLLGRGGQVGCDQLRGRSTDWSGAAGPDVPTDPVTAQDRCTAGRRAERLVDAARLLSS
jgi:hypothetical protein